MGRVVRSWESIELQGGTAYPNHPPSFEPTGAPPCYGTNGMTLRDRIAIDVFAVLIAGESRVTPQLADEAVHAANLLVDSLAKIGP